MARTPYATTHRGRCGNWLARLRKPVAAICLLGILLALAAPRQAPGDPQFQPAAKATRTSRSRQPAPSGRTQIPIGNPKDTATWYQDPVAQISYVFRMSFPNSIGRNASKNIAVAFVDITGLKNIDPRGYRIEDSAALRTTDPALYDELGLADRPNVKQFAIVPNDNESMIPGSNGANHSERILVLQDLANLSPADGGASITPDRIFALYSDNSPCGENSENCAASVVPGTADVYFTNSFELPKAERYKILGSYLDAAEQQAMTSTSYKSALAAQMKLNKEFKAAEPERAKILAAVKNRALVSAQRKSIFALAAKRSSDCGETAVLDLADPCAGATASANSAAAAAASDNSFAQVLAEPNVASPGGIDFSRIQLDYLSDPGDGSGLQYAFAAPTSLSDGGSASGALDTAGLASAAFFVWLELDPSTDWVNLNPTEPDRIVDSQMGRTDVGRIMLQADLALKKEVGTLIYPDSALGRTFWSELEGGCFASRVWVVPSPAQIYTTGDKLYILNAPLNVKMEADYLQLPKGQTASGSCPQQDPATQAHNEALYRNLVLPKLVNMVNTDPQFADLRTIYRSRIAAEWYRNLSDSQHTTYADLIDQGDVSQWTTKTGWTPEQTFQQYVTSYTKGEWHITHTENKGEYTYKYEYTYGGVDLTTVPLQQVSSTTFAADDPGLAQNLAQSLTTPTTDDSGTVMFGSPTPLQADKAALAAQDPAAHAAGPSLPLHWLPLLALLLPLTGAGVWGRNRRLRRTRAKQNPQAPKGPPGPTWAS